MCPADGVAGRVDGSVAPLTAERRPKRGRMWANHQALGFFSHWARVEPRARSGSGIRKAEMLGATGTGRCESGITGRAGTSCRPAAPAAPPTRRPQPDGRRGVQPVHGETGQPSTVTATASLISRAVTYRWRRRAARCRRDRPGDGLDGRADARRSGDGRDLPDRPPTASGSVNSR